MSKRKALSGEEKRCKFLEFLQETNEVCDLKELERRLPKEKGIVQQSIKGILEELVNSGEVQSGKCAGSKIYWSFYSGKITDEQRRLAQRQQECATLDANLAKARETLQNYNKTAATAEQAAVMERELAELRSELSTLSAREAELNASDDEDVGTKQSDAKKILEAANRWTDNIFSIKSFCKQKFNKEDRELDKAFHIPDDLDYLQF